MKTLKTRGLLLIFLFAWLLSFSQENAVTKEAAASYDKIVSLFNSKDFEGYSNHVMDNVECYTGVFTPLLWEGKANWMGFINGLKNFNYVNYNIRQPSYRNFGNNTVTCNGYFVFTTVDKNGNTEVQTGRQSTLLIKSEGIWKIASNHFSAMF